MRLMVSPSHAMTLLGQIAHATCQKGTQTHWRLDASGDATAESVLWLYCWAKTGQGSEKARVASVQVFDQIFSVGFIEFDRCINDHEWARQNRYKKVGQRNLEQEFMGRLNACRLQV
jgi:hypothetical protein